MNIVNGTRSIVSPTVRDGYGRDILSAAEKTIYILASGDNSDGLTISTAFKTIADANTYISTASNGVLAVQLGDGTYTPIESAGLPWGMGEITGNFGGFPDYTCIRGNGIKRTIIQTSFCHDIAVMMLGNNRLEDLFINCTKTDGSYQFPIIFPCRENDIATIKNVRTVSYSDALFVYVETSTLNIYNSIFQSKYDTLRALATGGSNKTLTINSYNNQWLVDGPFPITATELTGNNTQIGTTSPVNVARAISATAADTNSQININMTGDYIRATNGGSTYTVGVFAGKNTTIDLHNVRIETSSNNGPNCYDIVVNANGVVTVDADCVYDPAKVLVEDGGVFNHP